MTDKEQIIQLYKEMYTAMVNKDRAELERVHDDSFVLVHMTGMRQPKEVYISSIMDGTLNYYRCEHEHEPVVINGEKATMKGDTKVEAAVYGGSGHVWRLRLDCTFVRREGGWKMTKSVASTY